LFKILTRGLVIFLLYRQKLQQQPPKITLSGLLFLLQKAMPSLATCIVVLIAKFVTLIRSTSLIGLVDLNGHALAPIILYFPFMVFKFRRRPQIAPSQILAHIHIIDNRESILNRTA